MSAAPWRSGSARIFRATGGVRLVIHLILAEALFRKEPTLILDAVEKAGMRQYRFREREDDAEARQVRRIRRDEGAAGAPRHNTAVVREDIK